jgi:hypothetical protein
LGDEAARAASDAGRADPLAEARPSGTAPEV